jgi:hypothetical protein
VFGIGVAGGSTLSARISSDRTSPVIPLLLGLTDPAGRDLLLGLSPKLGPRGPAVTNVPVVVSGSQVFTFAAEGGGAGLASMKVTVRPVRPRATRLEHRRLYTTSVVKVREEIDRLEARVDGLGAAGAILIRPDGTEFPLSGAGGHYLLRVPDDEDHPDGVYFLRVTGEDASSDTHAFQVARTFPSPVTIGTTEPRIGWSLPPGGEDIQVQFIRVADLVSGAVFYEAALPGVAVDAEVPTQVRPIGWPYQVEVRTQTPGRKVAVAEVTVPGQAREYNVTHPSVNDHVFVADTRDPEALAYEAKYFVGLARYTQSTGTFARIADRGRFSFLATDDGGAPAVSPFPVLFVPGRFLVGRSWEGHLFAGPPRSTAGYVPAEFSGLWNLVGVEGGAPTWATVLINKDFSYRFWRGTEGLTPPDFSGSLSDVGGGVLRATVGAQEFGRIALLPDAGGGGLMTLDTPGGGLFLGARRSASTAHVVDSFYDLLSSAGPGVEVWRLAGENLVGPAGENLPVSLGEPWEGMFLAGDAVGILAPEGTLFLVAPGPGGAVLRAGVKE